MMQTGNLAKFFLTSRKSDAVRRDVIAAVDLGSNSFHMVVAKVMNGQLHVIDHLREMVQLGAGLNRNNVLSAAAQRRAIACLERFGQRLGDLPRAGVRAVGTNTLRNAVNAKKFLSLAQATLGHRIEVVSGHEEARLIYAGVAHSLADEPGRRLVLDIGGGSTEFIIGERFEPLRMESLSMGCVGMSRQYFPAGAITAKGMKKAEIAARLELRNIETDFRRIGWETCVGASGTINAIQSVVRANGWADRDITPHSLEKLRDALIAAKHVKRLALPGLRADRAPVFPGGVAILFATFDSLRIEALSAADGALREGVLYDLLGRIRRRDIRHQTINALCVKYHIDVDHAARVEQTALHCLKQAAGGWRLGGEEYRRMLIWAARLHEIGLTLAHNQHHKHGAYLIEHCDMPGFSRQDQELLAALVRGHRRKFPASVFREFGNGPGARRLCLLLRLAVLLHRSRSREKIPKFSLRVTDKTMRVRFPRGWLAKRALTLADLKQEADYIEDADVRLIIAR